MPPRHSHMRASHADRERVIDTLKAAYAYGLVTKDEFDERVGQTFASRTYAELALITGDIPAGLAAAPPPLKPAPARANPPARLRPAERAVIGTAALAGLLFVAAFFAGNPTAGLLGLTATGCALVSILLGAAQILRSRRDSGSGHQLPPARPIGTDSGTGQFPRGSRRRPRDPADAARSHPLRPQPTA
jgi:Domain of unknown function (DUF1707)